MSQEGNESALQSAGRAAQEAGGRPGSGVAAHTQHLAPFTTFTVNGRQPEAGFVTTGNSRHSSNANGYVKRLIASVIIPRAAGWPN